MKALLQQVETGLYFAAPGQWTPDPGRAHDFKSSVTAQKFCLREGMAGVNIVLKFDVDKYDIVLSTQRARIQRDMPDNRAGG